MEAIKRNSPELVREALEAGAKVTDAYHNRMTALEFAQSRGAVDAARELIKHGADVNMRVGKKQRRLIERCVDTGDYGFTMLLLENGADATGLVGEGYFKEPLARANSWAR